MKKFNRYVLVCILLTVVVGCAKKERPGPASQKSTQAVLKLLPEQTEVLVKFGPFETLYTNLAVTDTSIAGQSVTDLESIKQMLGFNPLSLQEFKTAGFDSGKPWGVALADIMTKPGATAPDMNVLVFVPVHDSQKALATIQSAMQKNVAGVQISQEGKLTVIQQPGTPGRLYLTSKDDYLLAAINPAGDAKAFLETALAGVTSLDKTKVYADVAAKNDTNQEIFVYGNIAKMVEANAAILTQGAALRSLPGLIGMTPDVKFLKDYQGFGVSVDLESPNLSLNTVLTVTPEATMKKLWDGIALDKEAVLGQPDAPVLFFSMAVNVLEYYAMLRGTLPPEAAQRMTAQLEMIKQQTKIDVEKEVINNLGGNFNIGVYDGSNITMSNYNTLATLTVKDETVTSKVLEKAFALLPAKQRALINKQQVGGVECYVANAGFTQVYLGLSKKNLIFASGKTLFEQALSGKASAGFLKNIADKDLAATLKGNSSVFYLNVDELRKIARNFEMFLPGVIGGQANYQKIQTTAGQFEYFLSSSTFQDNAVVGNMTIKTRFTQPFAREVANLTKDFLPQAQQ